MLAFYQRWALRLAPFRPLFLSAALVALLSFFWLVFAANAEQSARWQLIAVVLAIAFAVLWLWSTLFTTQLPEYDTQISFWRRLKLRLLRFAYFLLALLFSVILLTTLYLGLRALKGIIAAVFF